MPYYISKEERYIYKIFCCIEQINKKAIILTNQKGSIIDGFNGIIKASNTLY
jgi:hypothetical protein